MVSPSGSERTIFPPVLAYNSTAPAPASATIQDFGSLAHFGRDGGGCAGCWNETFGLEYDEHFG